MDIRYVTGIDREPAPMVADLVLDDPARGAVRDDRMQHAVANGALVDASDVAVALCGAAVWVRRGRLFPESGADGGDVHAVCLDLAAAAQRAGNANRGVGDGCRDSRREATARRDGNPAATRHIGKARRILWGSE